MTSGRSARSVVGRLRQRLGVRPLRRAVLDGARSVRHRFDPLVFPEAVSSSEQWQRVAMNRAIDAHLDRLGPGLSAVEISGDGQAGREWGSYRSLGYPEFDLCAELGDVGSYDVVICEQVLEHVVDPAGAVRNLYELCAPGGNVVVSTPFLIKVHELPLYGMFDYWRFTPRGLRLLLEQAGFEVDRVDTWGNRVAVVGNLDRWSAHRRWLPLANRADLAVVVWAFAHRPAEGAMGGAPSSGT